MSSQVASQIEEARKVHQTAIERMEEVDIKIQALPPDAPNEERELLNSLFTRYTDDANRAADTLERLVAIEKSRKLVPGDPEVEQAAEAQRTRITTGREEPVYRPDVPFSFFRDIYHAQKGISDAGERLHKHQLQMKVEQRDVTTADPGAGTFVPPVYMSNLWAELPRNRRPFADAIRKMPLPDVGTSFTIPRLTTGTTVASQAGEAQTLSETDADGTLLTVNVETIGGQQDMSIQAFERTQPGFDAVVAQDLRAAYDAEVDRQCLHGAGSGSNELLGIGGVSGRNTVTWTESTPTVAAFVPELYDCIQQVADGRKEFPDLLVMHYRRGAWLGSALHDKFPLFQLGSLNQAAGTQDRGFVDNVAGLRVILDGNVITTEGAGTNQDRVFVVNSQDIILFEGPLRVRVLEQTLANTLQIKIQLFAYVALASGRQPEAIGEVVGTGLANPF